MPMETVLHDASRNTLPRIREDKFVRPLICAFEPCQFLARVFSLTFAGFETREDL